MNVNIWLTPDESCLEGPWATSLSLVLSAQVAACVSTGGNSSEKGLE